MKGDVLVVGSSPAGISAATAAARAGANTILIDRDLGRFNHPANTLFEGMASRMNDVAYKSHIRHRLKGMRIISPRGCSICVDTPGYFLDREGLDGHMLRKARDSGVTQLRCEAVGSRLEGGLRYLNTTDGELGPGLVIDASGVDATIARGAGLSPMRHPEDIAWAFEATVEWPGLGDEEYFEYWVGSISPGWKATFSPGGGDIATLGVFVRGYGRQVQPFFRRYLRHFQKYKAERYGEVECPKVISVSMGGDPIATLPGEIAGNAMMVTGGAAGQSGLAYSMRAGEICGSVGAKAVESGDISLVSLRAYEKKWWAEFGMEYRLGRASLEMLRSMSDAEIDRLIRGLAGRNLLAGGGQLQKAISAGLSVASIMPGLPIGLIRRMMSG